jgi:hypothetical protein
MTNPTSNFGWQMPTSTDLVTDLPADFEVFGQAVDTSLADLKGGTTGQVLKKNTNADMDFVWAADSAGMTNPMTTTGDTIYSSSGSTPARLGIGSTGQILTVSGGVPTWAAPAAGGGLTLLSTTTFSGGSVVLSSISGSYKNLHLEWTGVYNDTQYPAILVRFNADTGNNYDYGATGGQNTNTGDFNNVGSQSNFEIGSGTQNTGASEKASGVLDVFNYAQSTNPVGFAGNSRVKQDVNWKSRFVTGQYRGSAAITSITILTSGGNFSGGTVRLYGVN